jgi:hypothetical protein
MRSQRRYRNRRYIPGYASPGKSVNRLRAEQAAGMRLKRSDAQLILTDDQGMPRFRVQTMLILNDMGPLKVTVFSPTPFARDQTVVFNIPNIRNFLARGRVAACKEVPLNPGILSQHTYRYRIEIDFEFASEIEQQLVENFCALLKATFLEAA